MGYHLSTRPSTAEANEIVQCQHIANKCQRLDVDQAGLTVPTHVTSLRHRDLGDVFSRPVTFAFYVSYTSRVSSDSPDIRE
jgi:hypothetical protein